MKRSKSYTWLSGLLRPKPEEREDQDHEEWGAGPWVRADVMHHDSCSKMMAKCCLLLAVVATLACSVRGTAEVMSHVTAHFGKSLEECREESGLSSDIMEEFKHFWSENFEVVHRELGCAIICMSNKFSLMHDDARMHHVNMDDYIKSFPNGEVLSSKMVELIHNCEKQYDDIPDDCERVVKVAACFKVDAKKEGIAPEVTMIEAVLEKY